ncbi:MAG: cytidylate kinase-like family protein [Eubacteriales bacterium]|nr:cytidylate kinase-like family protein [Eubacteriales bacterium]
MDKKVIITIARQYGSGGKTIGKMLSEEMDIPCYDRDIIRLASEDSGIHERLFGQVDEIRTRSLKDILTSKSYDPNLIPPESNEFTSKDNLFNYQAKIIKELADKGSCIFIGRCADNILRDYDNVVRVFIHADEDYCFQQAKERNSMSDSDLKTYIRKIDKHRADFYKYYTGNEWNNAKNYDLSLNTSKLGFEKCVEVIKDYVNIYCK